MGSSRLSLKRSLLFSAAFAASLLSTGVFAQQNTNTNTNTGTATTAAPTTNRNTPSSSTSQRTTPSSTPPSTSANTRSTSSPSSLTLPPLGTSTGAGSTGAGSNPTGLPTLSKTVNTEIPNYPPPTIPPTQNAPFMNHSTLPDGTVFIAVGAILGAFGAAILAWRGIVACLLHRSVERATLAQHAANDKASSFPAPPSQFYKFLERDPSPVGGGGGGGGGAGALGGRIHRKSHRGPNPSATPSQTNLFFSPTAGPGGSTGIASSSNRDSRYLPSGFYASASAIPGHNAGNSISLSTLRPSSRGRMDPSPPHSPDVGPHRNFSASSLSLNRPPSANERAPSAFLDDLLGDQPGGMPYPGQQMNQQPYGGRYPSGPDGQYYSQSPSPPGHRGY